MARVYLDAADAFTVSNQNVSVYGATGTEVVTIGVGVSGVVLDQNIERVVFANTRSSYTFQQSGNQLLVYSGTVLLSRTPLQDDSDGTQFSFADGVVDGKISATGMTLGGASVGQTPSAGNDVTTPTVTAFSPADGATGVAVGSNITLTFSEAIQRGTGSIQLRSGSATGTVVETFDAASSSRLIIADKILTLDPISNLSGNTRYFVTFAAGSIKDLAGNAYTGTSTYDFTTQGSDTIAPTVTAFSPADGATGVAVGSNITLTFSEAIQRGTGLIQLHSGSATGTVVETFDAASSSRLSLSGSTLTVDPTSNLTANTQYFLTFAAGTIKDLAGNSYAGVSNYDFKTLSDTTAPTISLFNPTDGATGVAIDSNITLIFSEAIQRGTGSIQLRSGSASGTVVETFDAASSSRLSLSGSMLTVDPTSNLSANTQYFLTFAAGTIKDLAGNSYAGVSNYDFKTAAASTSGSFNIVINYTGEATYKPYFDAAKALWEKVIISDVTDYNGVDDLEISASVTLIDGVGSALGQAGPTNWRPSTLLPYKGIMKFDSADMASMVSNGTLASVVAHEMGHVLGFGTLWDGLSLNTVFAQYTGRNALAEYRALSGNASATYVPLETGGGTGTANSHWSESVFGAELMAGYAESAPPMPLSRLTIAAMKDLGYGVDFNAAQSFTLSLQAQPLELIALTGVDDQQMTL